MYMNVEKRTVCLSMYSTVGPMAREGRGDITGNVQGQGFTSPSPCTHVQGAYGAPTGAVGPVPPTVGRTTENASTIENGPWRHVLD